MESESGLVIVRRVGALIIALGVIGFIYWMGLWDVAGALALSGLLVSVVWYVRSGALSPVCQQRRNFIGVRNSARSEFSKAMVCAAVGLDLIKLILSVGYGLMVLRFSVVSQAAMLALVVVWLLGTGTFLVRSYAAYLLSLRP